MEVITIYKGPLLNPNDMVNGPVKQAYISWREQKTRCYNKKREKYKNYGAKGIEVKYSSREFIGWWIENIKEFTGKNPTVSRIDHSGNYEFGNIKIESRLDNTIERNNRVESFHKKKNVFLYGLSGELITTFRSRHEAARFFDINSIRISSFIKRNTRYKSFKFGGS